MSTTNDPAPKQSAPIACLSDDVLHDIFLYLVGLETSFDAQDPPQRGIPILAVSQVCRYWRHLALASPLLWSYIRVDWPRWPSKAAIFGEFLGRSKDTLLHVALEGNWRDRPSMNRLAEMMCILSDHTYRIETLTVERFSPRVESTILRSFTLPAPQMRRLRIVSSGINEEEDSHIPLFGGEMPRLRDVSVFGVPTLWPACRDLTSLQIGQDILSTEELLRTLRNCPNLHSLDLAFQKSDRQPFFKPVVLSRLQNLHVYCTRARNMRLLAYLSFPMTTVVFLRYAPHHLSMNPIVKCGSLLENASEIEDMTLELKCSGENVFQTIISSQTLMITVDWANDASGPAYNPTREYTGFGAVTFPTLKRLVIRACAYRLRREQWVRILKTLSTVTSIGVQSEDSTITTLFRALALSQTAGLDSQTVSVLCPNLSSFDLCPGTLSETMMGNVLSCFESRAALGVRLASCKIKMPCGLHCPPAFLAKLETIVGEVTVCHDTVTYDIS
ncbi:hypothetical protein AcW1_006574 [Taiwanofungus camphoratus]|nr:hypothetical protein AcW1_006574 [Antrodia cinnamomea]